MNKKILSLLIVFIFIFLFLNNHGMSKHNERNLFLLKDINIETLNGRIFLWIQPQYGSPDSGYPIIFLFHGAGQHAFSWMNKFNMFNRNQMSFTKDALSEGFFLILLESSRPIWPGPRTWDVFNRDILTNKDFQYLYSIKQFLENSTLPLDLDHIYGAGFSSGGFMCSRIGISDGEFFTAIALNSGCNADSIILTKRGPIFNLTSSLNISINHPPTLFLHGAKDNIVPMKCSSNYYHDLYNTGVKTKLIIENNKGHIWLNMYNDDVLEWFKMSSDKDT